MADCDCGEGGARIVRRVVAAGVELTEAAYVPATRIAEHVHTRPHICLVLDGGYEERYRGTTLRAAPASIFFHPPGEAHSNRFGGDGGRCLSVTFPAGWLDRVPRASADRIAVSSVAPPSRHAFALFDRLVARHEWTASELPEAVLALIDDVLARPALAPAGEPPRWLERVRDRVEDEFRRAPPLAELAGSEAVHPVSLARAFRRHYGCTVGAYVRQKRLEFACRVLAAGDADLATLAYRAGFADQSHFTRTFKRRLGMTPGEFRAWRRG